jgi:uncharacterized SAM-binding protein YcdF (DUF218 family)
VARRRSPKIYLSLAFLALLVVLFLTRSVWLAALGHALVHDDGPAKADLAVVLAGDPYGYRILKAADLIREGYVPVALISGPPYYGTSEAELAVTFAVQHGNPARWFIPFPDETHSTRQEAAAILPELDRRHIHNFLLVTSNYHTARARRIYRSLLRHRPDLGMRTVAAPDRYFRPDSWWHSREGRKIFFFEWTKTLAEVVGQ